MCIGILNSVDGTNITTNAPAHTVDCLLLQYCIDSGFTVMEEVGGYYKAKYQLDPNGVTLAVAALQQLKTQGVVNNVQFTVTGVPGAAATYNNDIIYNGQPLGLVLAVSAVVAETPGPEITVAPTGVSAGADAGSSSSGGDVAEEIEVAGGIVIGIVIVASLLALAIFEKKGHQAEGTSSRIRLENGFYRDAMDANMSTMNPTVTQTVPDNNALNAPVQRAGTDWGAVDNAFSSPSIRLTKGSAHDHAPMSSAAI